MRYLFLIVFLPCIVFSSCSEEKKQPQPPAPAEAKKTDVEILKEKVAANPEDAESWYHLAELYERAGMYQEETDALNRVVALRPDMGYAYFKLGTAYNMLERYQDAVTNFLIATRTIHNQPVIYNNMAISYGKLGKTDNEIAALKKAVAMRPTYATARFNLGMAYLRKGRRDEALNQYRALMKFDEGAAGSLKKEIDARGK